MDSINPEAFIPERFENEQTEKRAWFGQSSGAKISQHEKSNILKKANFSKIKPLFERSDDLFLLGLGVEDLGLAVNTSQKIAWYPLFSHFRRPEW